MSTINVSVYITYTQEYKISYNMKIQQLGQQFKYTIATTEERKKVKKIDAMDGTSSMAQIPLKDLSDLSFPNGHYR